MPSLCSLLSRLSVLLCHLLLLLSIQWFFLSFCVCVFNFQFKQKNKRKGALATQKNTRTESNKLTNPYNTHHTYQYVQHIQMARNEKQYDEARQKANNKQLGCTLCNEYYSIRHFNWQK